MHDFKREVWEKLRLDKLWEIEATLANGTVIKRGGSRGSDRVKGLW